MHARGLRFKDLCALAECYGLSHVRTVGSHAMYRTAGRPRLVISLQPARGGMAKEYQVKQVLRLIDRLTFPEE